MFKFKLHIETRITEEAEEAESNNSGKSLQTFVSMVKLLREALCMLVRITAVMMRALESKTKTDLRLSIGRCLTIMTGQVSSLSAMLLKTFETLDKGGKKESVRCVTYAVGLSQTTFFFKLLTLLY